MKTFIDKLNESDNSDVIKEYKIDSIDIKFYKYNFKAALALRPENVLGFPQNDGLWCEMARPNDSIITIKITENGTSECENCDGRGEHYCDDCDCYHDCGVCDGTGTINDDNSDGTILLEDVINLNQGELF